MTGFLRYASSYSRAAMAFLVICVAAMYVLAFAGRPSVAYTPTPPTRGQVDEIVRMAPLMKPASVVAVASARKLVDLFDGIGYRLDKVRRHGAVPRLYLAQLPGDLTDVRPAATRKALFIRAMLPLILRANERILQLRARLRKISGRIAQGGSPSRDEAEWLTGLARRYRAASAVPAVLLLHVDIVPPSLALAQGAEESGWGTSRFAVEGNALYGQRIFRGTGGIVPNKRADGERHRVRTFGRLLDGVESYMHNLNSHPAYAELRALRARMRNTGGHPEGESLAGALVRYSERGADYVAALQAIIRINNFSEYDRVKFAEGEAGLDYGT